MGEFPAFKKIPRLSKPVVITEKIDGTNGVIQVERQHWGYSREHEDPTVIDIITDETVIGEEDGLPEYQFVIRAGSRNRWLAPGADNFGFASWVQRNAKTLTRLGPGLHYGEWFGKGIQRGYGLDDRRFALFNVAKWYDPRDEHGDAYRADFANAAECPEVCTVVPVMAVVDGHRMNDAVAVTLDVLTAVGSWAVPGFRNPEGVVAYHTAANQLFKAFPGNDNTPKSLRVAA
ncbi:RNA ligase family protein [Micromonospora sp. PSH03]|uniref:RNA ligase family protein n=1 Tax=Micromonospora salmantinae TaxID=2911211 RepID=UPI001EE8F6EB|nr:RNA ligase family protein [Micromonospora salmantinae]MCG5459605.1 RNA ligase family protein [Micromonospora salmantinae]